MYTYRGVHTGEASVTGCVTLFDERYWRVFFLSLLLLLATLYAKPGLGTVDLDNNPPHKLRLFVCGEEATLAAACYLWHKGLSITLLRQGMTEQKHLCPCLVCTNCGPEYTAIRARRGSSSRKPVNASVHRRP